MDKKMGVKYAYVASGKEGIEWIRTASAPFSMVLSDQQLPDMVGAEFFEQAKALAPDTLRYLIAGHADIKAVTSALNKGAIHRYISKPWIEKEFVEAVKKGLELFELAMENHRLFKLAKAQNEKLHDLNMNLKKDSGKYKKAIIDQEREIEDLNRILEKGFENRNYINETVLLLKEKNMMEEKQITTLSRAVISELFEQFQDIATRHGFEMLDNHQGG